MRRAFSLTFLTLSSGFYLLVVPMLAALGQTKGEWLGVIFGAFMLLQLFFLIFLYAYAAAARFYAWPINFRLMRFSQRVSRLWRHPQFDIGPIALMFISYALLDYAFAVLYVYISRIDHLAFSGGALGLFEGWYFSVLTGATVAFGDIIPKSTAARIMVAIQITLSLFYVVLLFSAAANHLSRSVEARADNDNSGG